MAELVFETTLKEVPVTIDGKSYILRELDGAGQTKWRGDIGGDITVQMDGTSTIKNINMEDPELRLLALCIHDAEGKLVPRGVMAGWPSSVLRKLYDAAQELSGLNEEGRKKQEAEAKK